MMVIGVFMRIVGWLFRFLIEEKVQERLIELLKTDHMASSLKLSILKALDITTNTAYGMENFLGWSLEVHCVIIV